MSRNSTRGPESGRVRHAYADYGSGAADPALQVYRPLWIFRRYPRCRAALRLMAFAFIRYGGEPGAPTRAGTCYGAGDYARVRKAIDILRWRPRSSAGRPGWPSSSFPERSQMVPDRFGLIAAAPRWYEPCFAPLCSMDS
jgi:hypothetical protein